MPATTTKPKFPKGLLFGLLGISVAVIALGMYSAVNLREVAELTEKEVTSSKLPLLPQVEDPPFDEGLEPEPEKKTTFTPADNSGKTSKNSPKPPSPSTPSKNEMPFAEPVFGNPLVVRLPGDNAKLGEISVEKYDSDGNATGEPLAQGTRVQIPDPNNPGGKIYFRVP